MQVGETAVGIGTRGWLYRQKSRVVVMVVVVRKVFVRRFPVCEVKVR
tara:strand:- start:529 stop:669 length:141 start_codon:yes stop_codon:yes gene_type:complete